jgi:hypothetical protein
MNPMTLIAIMHFGELVNFSQFSNSPQGARTLSRCPAFLEEDF